MDWDDLKIVLAICRNGTLSGAARSLGVNHSTVFRRINAIEAALDVRLFDRLPQGYVMTQAGEAVQRSAQSIDDQVHDLTRELLGRDLRLEGPIRVTAPEGVAIRVLTPLLGRFCSNHPDIRMDLVTTSDALRLSRREADIAVRVTGRPPEDLFGRRICRFRFALYASRGYLNRHRDADIEDHDWILTEESFEQLPASLWKKKDRQAARIAMTSNNVMVTIAAAKQGNGVVPLPCFLGDAERGLVRLTGPLEELTRELWVLAHPDLRNTARVRAAMSFLVDGLVQHGSAFEGAPGR